MAKVTGMNLSYVQRIWRSNGLQPHRIRTFKLSNDPQFAAKVSDRVGEGFERIRFERIRFSSVILPLY